MRRLAVILGLVLAPGLAQAQTHPLTLRELQTRARANDLRVQEAEDQLHVLEAQYKQAYWAWFPKFDTTVMFAGPIPEYRNDGLGGASTPLRYNLDFGNPGILLRTEATAALPIYTFGKLTALKEAGEKGVEIGQHLKTRAQDEAAFQAAEAYFGYQLARQGKSSLKESLQQLDDAQKTLQRMLAEESSQVTKTDNYKVAFFRKQVEARGAVAETGMDLALAAVRLLGGFKPDEPIELAEEDLREPKIQLQPVGYYLDLAAKNRPELKALGAGLFAKNKEVFIRERMFLPDFGIAGFFRWSWASSTTRQLSAFAYDPYDDLSGGIGLVAHQTFDFPVKSAQMDQARAEYDKLTTDQKLAVQAIELEVRKTYGDLVQALTKSHAQTDGEKEARRWATAASASFDLGTTDTTDLMQALAALAVASTEKLTAWHDAEVGSRALGKVVGTPLVTSGTTLKAE